MEGARVSSMVLGLLMAVSLAVMAFQPPIVPAVAWHDCAPWDGPAFTVAVGRPGDRNVDEARPWLQIAIWHEAGARHGVTYRFPDTDGRTGAVSLGGTAFPSAAGTVTFPRATTGNIIEGSFDLVAPDGRHLAGRFRGPWSSRKVMCGA